MFIGRPFFWGPLTSLQPQFRHNNLKSKPVAHIINRRLAKEKEKKNKQMCSVLCECDNVAAPYPRPVSSRPASTRRPVLVGTSPSDRLQTPQRASEPTNPTWVLLKNKNKRFGGPLHLPVLLGEQRVPRSQSNKKTTHNHDEYKPESEETHIAHGHQNGPESPLRPTPQYGLLIQPIMCLSLWRPTHPNPHPPNPAGIKHTFHIITLCY